MRSGYLVDDLRSLTLKAVQVASEKRRGEFLSTYDWIDEVSLRIKEGIWASPVEVCDEAEENGD